MTMELMVTKRKTRTYQLFAERLHRACDVSGLPQGRGRATQLGALVGVGYKGASKWLNSDGMPDMGHATELAIALGVEFDWLMTGRGSMKSGTVLRAAEEQTKYQTGGGVLARDEQALLEKYRQLKPKERTQAQAVVDALTSTRLGVTKKTAS